MARRLWKSCLAPGKTCSNFDSLMYSTIGITAVHHGVAHSPGRALSSKCPHAQSHLTRSTLSSPCDSVNPYILGLHAHWGFRTWLEGGGPAPPAAAAAAVAEAVAAAIACRVVPLTLTGVMPASAPTNGDCWKDLQQSANHQTLRGTKDTGSIPCSYCCCHF